MIWKRNIMRWAPAILVILCGLLQAQDIRTNAMPGTDFSKYHTYKWVAIQENAHPDQIMDAEIKQAVDAQLSAKGFTKTDSDTADMYVAYQVSVDQERQWNAWGMGGGWRWGGMGTATSSTIQIGTLGVDLYDASKQQLIWRGEATKTLDPSKSQEKNMRTLDKAMAKLFKNFPPIK